MWMWRQAQMSPSFELVSVPFGPSSVIGADPATWPEWRTGASTPRWNSSVRETSTWQAGRSGPSTRTPSIRRRGPTMFERLLAGELPGLAQLLQRRELGARPEEHSMASLA
jgi:hypothetical protein